MRETNLSKWNQLEAFLQLKKDAILQDYFKDKEKPTTIYKASTYEINELKIIGIFVRGKKEYYHTDKPTKIDIEYYRDYVQKFNEDEKQIFFRYQEIYSNGGSATGAYKIQDIEKDKCLSFNRDELVEFQKELLEKYGAKEGYQACAYCGKQVPIESLVPYKIIFQDSKPDPYSKTGWKKFVNQKTNMYCSNSSNFHSI